MAGSVKVEWKQTYEATETLALGLDNVPGETAFPHSLGSPGGTLSATSTPPATKTFSDNVALVAGTKTLDLQALAGPAGTTVNFTGLKVQLIALRCPEGNTLPVLVQKGDANAYNLLGADNASAETFEVMPGDDILIKRHDTLEDVDATHSDIKFTGNGTETINVGLTAG